MGIIFVLLSAIPNAAYAGAGCLNACTRDPGTGHSCLDDGFGCNPSAFRCEPCFSDLYCQPGGTCSEGVCLNVDCGLDAGIPDAELLDTGLPDTGLPDAAGVDSGMELDASVGGRGGRGGIVPKGQYEEGCACSDFSREDSNRLWSMEWASLLIVFLGTRIRKRRGRAPKPPILHSSAIRSAGDSVG